MKYCEVIDGVYVSALGANCGGVEISEGEYNDLLAIIHSAPSAPDGYIYKLRAADLERELVELPPEPDPGEEDATAEDYENALLELGVRL